MPHDNTQPVIGGHVYRIEYGEIRARYEIEKITDTQIICTGRCRLRRTSRLNTQHGIAYARDGYGSGAYYVLGTAEHASVWRIREMRVRLHDNWKTLTDQQVLACMEACKWGTQNI